MGAADEGMLQSALIYEEQARDDKQRNTLWKNDLLQAATDKDWVEANAGKLLPLLLETCKIHHSRAGQRAVLAVVRATLRTGSPAMLRALSGALVKTAAGVQGATRLPPRQCLVYLQWTTAVLQHMPVEAAEKAAGKLIECQLTFLACLEPSPHIHHVGRRYLLGTLLRCPHLVPTYLSAANGQGTAILVSVLTQFYRRTGQLDEQRGSLLQLFCSKCLGSRDVLPMSVYVMFKEVLASATETDVTDVLLPATTRSIKQRPEQALTATAHMLKAIRVPLDTHAGSLQPVFLLQAKHAREPVRALAAQCVWQLGALVTEVKVLDQLACSILAVLDGSAEGKLKSATERCGVTQCLSGLAGTPVATTSGSALASTAEAIITTLCKMYEDEGTEEGRLCYTSALGAWLPLCEAVPACGAARFSSALGKEKEVLRKAHLQALMQSVAQKCVDVLPDDRRAAEQTPLQVHASVCNTLVPSLAPHLIKLASDGLTKATIRQEGLMALLVLAAAASGSAVMADMVPGQRLWRDAFSSSSAYLAPSTVSKLASEDLANLALLLWLALTCPPLMAVLQDGNMAPVCRGLTLLLLSHVTTARAAATACVRHVVATTPAMLGPLLDGVQHWLTHPTQAVSVASPPSDGQAETTQATGIGLVGKRLATALLAVTPAGPGNNSMPPPAPSAGAANGVHHLPSAATAVPPEVLASLLLASHNPVVVGGDAKRSQHGAWGPVRRKLGPAVPVTLSEHAEAVCEQLVGVSGVAADESNQRMAAVSAVSAIMAEEGTMEHGLLSQQLFHVLWPTILALTDRTEHDALTHEQLLIYQTPAGTLSWETASAKTSIGDLLDLRLQVVGAKQEEAMGGNGVLRPSMNGSAKGVGKPAAARPSARGVTGPAAISKGPSVGASGKGGGKGNQQEALRREQLAQEAEVRASVCTLRDRLSLGLQLVEAVARGNPNFAHEQHMAQLSALVTPLLPSQLVGSTAAFSALCALSDALPPPLGPRGGSLYMAAGLRLAAVSATPRTSGVTPDSLPHDPLILKAVQLLAAACKDGEPLPLPTYRFCFPLLQAATAGRQHCPGLDPAVEVLALHVAPHLSVPRGASLAVLYHVLGVLPSYADRVVPLMEQLCQGCTEDDLEAALQGVLSPHAHVRLCCLRALTVVPCLAAARAPADVAVITMMWLAKHDVVDDVADLGGSVWLMSGCDLQKACLQNLLHHCQSMHDDVRQSAARAVAGALLDYPASASDVLADIIALYDSATSTQVSTKAGAALVLEQIAPFLAAVYVAKALNFLLARALADPDEYARSLMVTAGRSIVDAHGSALSSTMLPLFEGYLDTRGAAAGLPEAEYDLVRQGAVVFLGTLASHLDADDPKVKSITSTLLDVLTTPSEAVQRSVSDCLPPLAKALASSDRKFLESQAVDKLMDMALKAKKYGDRRGAAIGLAGLVKGLSIRSLNDYGIMKRLQAAVENKADVNMREGALMAFEALSERLGRLFEPWITHVLPLLLVAYGDASAAVREATDAAARTMMRQLTAHGVKLVLPSVLKGCEDKSWRTKQGSVQVLGSMRSCAPTQLATALPTIVPRLGEVLADPHPKVQASAKEALNQVASIIRNPEVSMLVPILLSALANPNKHSKEALEILLTTTFVNTIDAASLALIVPVVYRGLRDRQGDTRKRGAMIVGNMSALVNDAKDLAPYVPLLMPEIKTALVDPLPEVRAVAAKALGSLFKGMGEGYLAELLPWLLNLLKSEGGAVERSGAAQGTAEVLKVAGQKYVDRLLPDIIASCSSRSAFEREGNLTLFKFLPMVITKGFQPHVGSVLPAILDGLADENEGVRGAAMSAGRTLVELYATTSLPLLLPAVEQGIISDNWRIRQSSVELLGDLLFKVAGTSGRVQTDATHDEDEGISTEEHAAAIVAALGTERRNHVLARVYLARSDVSYGVRTSSLHVWKSIVSNTPRTLSEIMPHLMDLMITSLAAEGEDMRTTSGKCLGEIVRKLGDRVLNQIIPILTKGISDPNAATREGVCYGLKEVLDGVSRHQLTEHLSDLLPAVQTALTDDNMDVRQAAGAAFGVLFKGGAGNVVDSIIPSLLLSLEASQAQASQALEGLRVILSVKPGALNSMVPKLMKPPLSSARLSALGSLAEVAGSAMHPHIGNVVPQLLVLASKPVDKGQLPSAAKDALVHVSAAIQEEGLQSFVNELAKAFDEPAKRLGAAQLTAAWAASVRLDIQEHVAVLLQGVIPLLAEEDEELVASSWQALNAVAVTIPKEAQSSFVRTLKDSVGTARDKQRRKRRPGPVLVPGFALPKSLAPVLPIYLQGILQGSSGDLRETAAEGLGELLAVTPGEAVRPFVVQVTGPLIRVMGDRLPSGETRAALLYALGVVIDRAGPGLKPFVPQLQATFVKCLSDASRLVRQRAAANLGALSVLSMRVDVLVADLAASCRTSDLSVREGHVSALKGCLQHNGARLSETTLDKVEEALQPLMPLAGEDEQLRDAVAQCTGVYLQLRPHSCLQPILAPSLAGITSSDWTDRWGAALMLTGVLKHAPDKIAAAGLTGKALEAAVRLSRDSQDYVKIAAARAAGHALRAQAQGSLQEGPQGPLTILAPVLVALISGDQSSDVQRMGLLVLRKVHEASADILEPAYPALVPSLCALIKGALGPIKLTAERTLALVLQLDKSEDPVRAFLASGAGGGTAKQTLTEVYIRRLVTMQKTDDDDEEI